MDITGASGAIPRNDIKRMDNHAERYYEEIRKRDSDVYAIAQNTNFSFDDIKAIKDHVFFTYHNLGKRKPMRFDPSYDMAVSWKRLIDGKNIQEMDIVMLNHELYELKLMAEGLDYNAAHDLAEQLYNYMSYTKALDVREGLY